VRVYRGTKPPDSPFENQQLDEGLKNPMKVTLILSRVIWR
jgi:hypothetical protein